MIADSLDLSFEPVKTARPATLTGDQIAHYNALGYVKPFDVFSPNEFSRNRAYFDRLIGDMGERGGYGINCFQARLRGIWDICTDARILDHVEDILGPNIICWASHVLSKRPHDPKAVPWHQDASFWRLSPARTVTVWLAIDDVDETNSAMRFIPGSHDKGALEVRESSGDAVFHIETAGADTMGDPVSNVLRAGQISLHADMLVHGSLANRSDRRRCGLTIRYCPPEVHITDATWARSVEAILARGEDPTGTWRHHARPDNDDITVTDTPLNIGGN